MDEKFQIEVSSLGKSGLVKKAPYYLSILREKTFSVSVERMPLVEYYVFFDDPIKSQQIKIKLYKTEDGRWYDKQYSEEAELNSPEFGIPHLNNEIKEAIDNYEMKRDKVRAYVL